MLIGAPILYVECYQNATYRSYLPRIVAGVVIDPIKKGLPRDAANNAADQARETYNEYSDDAAAGTWWAFAGLLIGAVISGFAGAAGARSVLNRDEKQVVTTRR